MPSCLRSQQNFAEALAVFKRAMRPRRLGERKGIADCYIESSGHNPIEHIAGASRHSGVIADVMCQARPHKGQGTLGIEYGCIERRHGTAGLPEDDETAQRGKRIQALFKSRLSDRIVNYIESAAMSQSYNVNDINYLNVLNLRNSSASNTRRALAAVETVPNTQAPRSLAIEPAVLSLRGREDQHGIFGLTATCCVR
jgi:hypothetical protein